MNAAKAYIAAIVAGLSAALAGYADAMPVWVVIIIVVIVAGGATFAVPNKSQV